MLLAGGEEGVRTYRCLRALGATVDLCAGSKWFQTHRNHLRQSGWCGEVMTPDSLWSLDANYGLYLSSGFQSILPRTWLEGISAPKLNLHASLLPKYRGKHGGIWALINDEEFTGVTLHHISAEVDAGSIVRQSIISVPRWSPLSDIQASLQLVQNTLLKRLVAGEIALDREEPGVLPSQIWPTRKPEDSIINWSQSPRKLFCFVRALSRPGIFAFSNLRGHRVEFDRVFPTPLSHQDKPGTVIGNYKDDSVLVAVKDGAVVKARVVKKDEGVKMVVGHSFQTRDLG